MDVTTFTPGQSHWYEMWKSVSDPDSRSEAAQKAARLARMEAKRLDTGL